MQHYEVIRREYARTIRNKEFCTFKADKTY